MPTDTIRSRTRAVDFALRAVAWSLGLFGLLRLNWVETHGLLPLTRLQGRLAVGLCGTPALPIDATLACSGADALALCVGAILAYPASWGMRLAGACGGLTLVLGLNTLRIGTLGRVAASPAWFETLHIYVWPAALTLAVAGYVFGWMRLADGGIGIGSRSPARRTPRFIILTAVFLLLFTAASPLYLESAGVLTVAAFIARAAAAALHVFGVEARAAANVLWTSRGGFAVTQECVSTPLIPVYLAAILAYASTWRQRALGLVATAPLFVGLGIARLLVVALPAALVASPLYLIHAFYQLLLAAVVVAAAAFWRHGAGGTALRRALTGMALGVAVGHLLGAPYAHVLTRAAEMIGGGAPSLFVAGTPFDDPQGAITLLPAFQVGLYMALWVAALVPRFRSTPTYSGRGIPPRGVAPSSNIPDIIGRRALRSGRRDPDYRRRISESGHVVAVGWRRFLAGLALLELIQMATLVTLHVLASHSDLTPHVRDVRAWAVVGPLLVVVAVVNFDRLLRRPTPTAAAAGGGADG